MTGTREPATYGNIRDDLPYKEYRPKPCHDCGHFPLIYWCEDFVGGPGHWQITCPTHFNVTHEAWTLCAELWDQNMDKLLERELGK